MIECFAVPISPLLAGNAAKEILLHFAFCSVFGCFRDYLNNPAKNFFTGLPSPFPHCSPIAFYLKKQWVFFITSYRSKTTGYKERGFFLNFFNQIIVKQLKPIKMSATIHFYIRSERPHSDNSAQVYMLFTITRKLKVKISLHKRKPIRKEFAKLKPQETANYEPSINNDMFCWDTQKERATSHSPNSARINQFFDGEIKSANDLILKYQFIGKPLTVEIFKKIFLQRSR